MKLGRPVRFPATAAPGLAVLLFHVNPAALKTAGSLVVLLAATVTTAAGLMVAVGRLRLRPRPRQVHAPWVRAVPDPGPPGQVSVHDHGPTASAARSEPGPVAGIATTEEAPDRPRTALDLLFGLGSDTPQGLSSQILSADADGILRRALENMPRATREPAVREATAAAVGFMDVDLIGALVAGWRRHHDLTAAAQRTLAAPGSIELVNVATLAVQGINVLSRQAHLMLPGVIPLSPGIRLLAAGDCPVNPRQAESAHDGHTERVSQAREGSIQA
jgi:hypothetical protein